ncbi:dual specificity testis-specific protein kinase 2-like, partial [Homarus americanus]|uniref:dual specificity testis-specific protein kinase 2-like n=1 Tax=Homarus americanus TaxID=6706 RepID=UPI001C4380F7
MDSQQVSKKTIGSLIGYCGMCGVLVQNAQQFEFIINSSTSSHLGEGAYGTCCKIHRPKGYWVAKSVPNMNSKIISLQREIRVLSFLRDVPGVQKIVMVCPEELTMITVFAGDSLKEYLKINDCTFSERLQIVQQVARTLIAINSRGWLHNDVKTGNICIQKTDKGIQATLIDFGIATKVGSFIKFNSTRAPDHTAPEVVKRCPLTTKADVYSVGRLLERLMKDELHLLTPNAQQWLIHAFNIDPTKRQSLKKLLKYLPSDVKLSAPSSEGVMALFLAVGLPNVPVTKS